MPALCPILVGRATEIARLGEALTRARSGRGGAVFLSGEAGIGKSRLVREVLDRAAHLGTAAIVGRAVLGGSSVAYRPLTEALSQLMRRESIPDDPYLRPWMPHLAPILPNLGSSPGVVVSGELTTADTGRSGALRGEAVVRLLATVAPPGGLVLALEDLHWSDDDTIDVVEYLSDNLASLPVLCVMTVRSEPVSPALSLCRKRRSQHIELPRLSAVDTAAMITACAPEADSVLAQRVARDAEGIPLLVEDVLVSRGVPRSFSDSVSERLGRFAVMERAVIDSAAVLGRFFDWRQLATVAEQPDDVVARALERGVELLLISAEGGEFRFRHALTREAVLEDLLPPQHQKLAARALERLDSEREAGDLAQLQRVADLAARSGDRGRAGRLLAELGRESFERGTLATAIDTLRQATAMLSLRDEGADAGLMLLEALALAGRVDEAVVTGGQIVRATPADADSGPRRARIHMLMAQAAVAGSRWQVASHQLESARNLLGGDESADLSPRLAVLEAEVAMGIDDFDRARQLGHRALASQAAAAPSVQCHAWELIGRADRLTDRLAARSAFEAALGCAEAAGLPLWRMRALHELGTIDMFEHEGDRRLLEARAAADDLGAMGTAAILDLQLCALYTCRWELDKAEGYGRQAAEIADRLGLGLVRAKAFVLVAGVHSMRADIPATEEWLSACMSCPEMGSDPSLEGFCLGTRATALLFSGSQGEAFAEFTKAASILDRLPHSEPAAFRAFWVLLLATAGDRRARAALDHARRSGISAFNCNSGMIDYAEAVLVGTREPAEASVIASRAALKFVNSEAWGQLSRLYAAEAAFADGWGNPDRWLSDTEGVFAARQLRLLEDKRRTTLEGGRPRLWLDLGVTAREADVLELVRSGMSNKAIATQLHLSPRTVEKHVESLLRKTGAVSRTHLATITAPRTT